MTNGPRRGWGVSVTPRPLFTPRKTRYPLYRSLGGPQGRSGQVGKISPPPGFYPWTVQPVASRYTLCWYLYIKTLFLIQKFQLEMWQRGCIFKIISNNCNKYTEKLYIEVQPKENMYAVWSWHETPLLYYFPHKIPTVVLFHNSLSACFLTLFCKRPGLVPIAYRLIKHFATANRVALLLQISCMVRVWLKVFSFIYLLNNK
jgi:hypothetical protein